MAGFRFPHIELEQEIKSLKTMARRFIDPGWQWALEQFLKDLQSIRNEPVGTEHKLNLRSLQTRPSKGEYEAGDKQGGRNVYAVISGTWRVRIHSSGPKGQIEFCGNASTKVQLYDLDEPSTRLAMWRLELGADDAPGCYVHAQILGDSDDSPFPKSVPIPRLPSIFVTPMSAVEFVLGELFQDKWAKVTAGNSHGAPWWRKHQQQRLKSLFRWYQGQLEKPLLSPWIALKAAKPDGNEFLTT